MFMSGQHRSLCIILRFIAYSGDASTAAARLS